MKGSGWLVRTMAVQPLGVDTGLKVDELIRIAHMDASSMVQLTALQANCSSEDTRQILASSSQQRISLLMTKLTKMDSSLRAQLSESFAQKHKDALDEVTRTTKRCAYRLVQNAINTFNVKLGAALKKVLDEVKKDATEVGPEVDAKLRITFQDDLKTLASDASSDKAGLNIKSTSPEGLQQWREHAVLRGSFLSNIVAAGSLLIRNAMLKDGSASSGMPPLSLEELGDLCGELQLAATPDLFQTRVLTAGQVTVDNRQQADTALAIWPTFRQAVMEALRGLLDGKVEVLLKKPQFKVLLQVESRGGQPNHDSLVCVFTVLLSNINNINITV